MSCKNIIFMTVLFVILPAWIGIIWLEALKIEGRWQRFLHSWVLGFVTMLSVAQILLVPMVALHRTLTEALRMWQICLTVLSLVIFYLVLMKHQKLFTESGIQAAEVTLEGRTAGSRRAAATSEGRTAGTGAAATSEGRTAGIGAAAAKAERSASGSGRLWTWIFGVLAAVLILLQAYIPARYEHGDDDDARFISEEVSAVEHDTMYWDDPITADQLYWNEGEVRKDFTSPWAMYVAMCSKMTGIAPAALSHTYLPFFLILLCYAVYFLIGDALLKGKQESAAPIEKTLLFLLFLSVLHLWGYTSTHTLASMLLLRIWQGKAVCASFLLPVLFYLMYQIMQREVKKGWVVLLYVAPNAACLLSGIGIVTAPVLLFLYGAVDFFYNRNGKKTLAVWLAAVPCGVYFLYYLIG